ncbi:MAG TPA: hypothetical protein VGQ60_05000 [Nitrospiraceae bacterium]|jgi:hypothetical protein|nr:hypothetical protein [Nitrospiraceae bacterium]
MRYAPILAILMLLSVGTISNAADPKATGILEGEVLRADPGLILMKKDSDGMEVRLRITDVTQKGADFKAGDKIEAFVTPEGTTTSVQPRQGGFNR